MKKFQGLIAAASVAVAACTGSIEDIQNKETLQLGTYTQLRGEAGGEYAPNDNYLHPISVAYHPTQKNTQLVLNQPGWMGTPTNCIQPDLAWAKGKTQVDVCPGHYPSVNNDDVKGADWGPTYYGDNYWRRVAVALKWALITNRENIDLNAGWMCQGASMGTSRCGSLPTTMGDDFWDTTLTTVKLTAPVTRPQDLINHPHYRDNPGSWPENFPAWKVHPMFMGQFGEYDYTYFNVVMGSNDVVGGIPTDSTWIKMAQLYRVSHFILYHKNGHNPSENGVDLPWGATWQGNAKPRMNIPVIAFTKSTADHCMDENAKLYERGYCNLGLEWDYTQVVDTAESLTVPLRYIQHTNIGGELPDQPASATVDVTLRQRYNPHDESWMNAWRFNFNKKYEWTFGDQSGVIQIDEEGEATIRVTIGAGSNYTDLVVVPAAEYEVETHIPMVYTQQPRHNTPLIVLPDEENENYKSVDDASNMQLTTDIGFVWQTTESNVKYRDGQGKEHTLYNCTESEETCTAMEARVSPDGTKVAFTKFLGEGAQKWEIWHSYGPHNTGLWKYTAQGSEIWVCDLTKDGFPCNVALSDEHKNRSPEWASNDLLVFTSDSMGMYPIPSNLGNNNYPYKSQHVHRGRLVDGKIVEVENLTPGKWYTMSPLVTTYGDICYSSLEGVAPKDFGSTPQNHWWIECMDINGKPYGNTEMGAHGGVHMNARKHFDHFATGGEGLTEIRGIRNLGELWPGYLSTSSYYRANSLGAMGEPFGWTAGRGKYEGEVYRKDIEDAHQYGDKDKLGSGRFYPADFKSLAPAMLSQDMAPRFTREGGKALGRAGYATAIPGDKYMITRGRGWCYRAVSPGKATYAAMGGEPPCKKQINAVPIKIVDGKRDATFIDPFTETTCIAGCDMKDHVWDSDYAGPYEKLYPGIQTPAIAEVKKIDRSGTCRLNIVDLYENEIYRLPGLEDSERHKVSFQGNADLDFTETMTEFGVEIIDHYTQVPPRTYDVMPVTGEKVYHGEKVHISEVIKKAPEEDGSLSLPIPCGSSWQHFGYDKDGNKVASGLSPLWAFETVTCHGCHDGHSRERAMVTYGGKSPEERFSETEAADRGVVEVVEDLLL